MSDSSTGKGLLFIISGPAGSGKTTICDGLMEKENLQIIVTSTTRSPRQGEIDGLDYHFLNSQDFEIKISEDAFYEYATVHNNYYGTQKADIIKPVLSGQNLLLNIDVQGAKTITEKASADEVLKGHIVTIFIMPPSLEELDARLRNRGTDSDEEIERRLIVARSEMEQQKHYNYTITSQSKSADLITALDIYKKEVARLNQID
ncbi:MAG: guanylate kinase [Opitutae bacterium]|nr:guanylate kinase [Opitutae bacterium]